MMHGPDQIALQSGEALFALNSLSAQIKWTIPYLLYQYVPDKRVKAVITPQRGHPYDIFVFTNLKKIKESMQVIFIPYILQVASRALRIPASKVHISETGTNLVPNASPTAASFSSDLYGMAVMVG